MPEGVRAGTSDSRQREAGICLPSAAGRRRAAAMVLRIGQVAAGPGLRHPHQVLDFEAMAQLGLFLGR